MTKSVLADGTTIYISVQRWGKHDKMPCLRAQAGFEPTLSDCESDTPATRLTQPDNTVSQFYTHPMRKSTAAIDRQIRL